MRSIRLSLIVYFLVLLALALGGVSWFVYRTTAQTLREKEVSSRNLIEARYLDQCEEETAALDSHLLRQAQNLAGMAHSSSPIYEPLFTLGALGTTLYPQGYLNVPLWLAEGVHPPLALRLHRMRHLDVAIDNIEAMIQNLDEHHPHEFFRIFRANGQPLQKSERLGEFQFILDNTVRDESKLLVEHFDNVEPAPDLKLRRVTLKASVPRFRASTLPTAWRFLVFGQKDLGQKDPGPGFKGPGPKGSTAKGLELTAKGLGLLAKEIAAKRHAARRPGGKEPGGKEPVAKEPPAKGPGNKGIGPRVPPPPPAIVESVAPVVFIQYASDTAVTEAKIADFAAERDAKRADLEKDTRQELATLRQRLLLICLATFVAIVAGGFFLVRLGLAPLARLSEAVSQVSENDFALKIDQGRLPKELQPIAGRLALTLDQLQRAFTREKQAAADISHELRTPLAAMMTNLEIALRKSRSAAEYRELLQDIQASSMHMAHLVQRLLALARLDAGADRLQPKPLDAAELAKQCAHMVRPLAEARGLALRVHLPEAAPLQTDPDKLREILNNLLHNAIEYNRPSGTIDLAVARVNGKVHVEVRDSGIGVSPQAREHIFERFYRADPSRHADTPHAGLGLSIVKSYLDLMGGTIDVQSNEKGSTFIVDLPAG